MYFTSRKNEKPISVRLPSDLRQLLDAYAIQNGRSRNLEIIERLAASLGVKGEFGGKAREARPARRDK